MISRYFIDRPIFASVLSMVIALAGGVALVNLPLALYPPISPPVVQVDCNYPGASARVVAETVASPIEQEVVGVEGMLYMSSQCTNDGSYNLMVTFQNGINVNVAQVLVQNRVNLAVPKLPDVIKKTGVTTRKRSPDILLSAGFYSPDGSYDQLYLSNYAYIQIKDELARLPGVSDVTMVGERDYSLRIWLDPGELASRNMTAGDVVNAIRDQNTEAAAGQIGQQPAPVGQEIQITLDILGRLTEVSQFEDIVLRPAPSGGVVRLKDVARVELGAKNQDVTCHVDGKPSASLTVWQLPDANALDTADAVKAKLAELKKSFPPGIDYVVRYDTTPFIRESIDQIFLTLRDGVLLVAFVVLLFLQNWRSAIIPLVAVPVAIIGTFAVMIVIGFSLNNLTLFGLVLAIGIVVDDAIVVVEAVEHHIEQGLLPREATIKAMDQVSGPVIAVGAVLSAVFIPCALLGGITGLFFRQFALTIAVSTLISAFNSLTLSPALAAMLLRPRREEDHEPLPRLAFLLLGGWLGWKYLGPELAAGLEHLPMAFSFVQGSTQSWIFALIGAAAGGTVGWLVSRLFNRVLAWLFWLFNAAFQKATGFYARGVALLLRVSTVVLLVYGGLLALTYWGFRSLPTGFIPSQDMGYLLVNVQLPDAASTERTQEVMNQAEQVAMKTPGIKHALAISGQSFLLNAFGSNFGSMFVILDDFDKRHQPSLYADAIAANLRKRFADQVPDAVISVFGPPPVRGVGRAGGFKFMIEDRGDLGLETLQAQADRLTAEGNRQPELVGLSSVFRADVPQLFVDVNRNQAMQLHVSLTDIFQTLQVYFGSLYVNDFNRFGRTWQVVVQADAHYRNHVRYIRQLKVRNSLGQMVPMGTVADIREVNGPLVVTRYNMYPAAFINGTTWPGVSSGQGIALMEKLAGQELLPAMTCEWTETAFLEQQAGSSALATFGFSAAMVLLVLAALYESWSLPLAIILVVPMGILSSIAGVALAHMDINILTQVGFVVLVGLASKNAILIVEFAKRERLAGVGRREATLDACRTRLRPIVMTSLAFILGVVPLMLSEGAGAEMRHTLGTAVFSGMLGVTLFGIFLTPVFFFVIDGLGETGVFARKPVRLAGSILLGGLTLGLPRLVGFLFHRSPKATPLAPTSEINEKARSLPPEVNGESPHQPLTSRVEDSG